MGKGISLKTKFLISTSMIIILVLAVTGYIQKEAQKELLVGKVRENGRILVESIAMSCVNTLLYQELGLIEEGGLLDNFIDELMEKKELHIQYAIIANENNQVIVSNDFMMYGKMLKDIVSLNSFNSDKTIEQVYYDSVTKSEILDISSPLSIAGKRWGTLKVGFSLNFVRPILYYYYRRIMFIGLIAIVLSVITINYIFSRLTGPLISLSGKIKGISSTDDFSRIEVKSRDEVGTLTEEFNSFLERLKEARENVHETQRRMIAQEKFSSLGRLSAGIAHEINNPLDGIKDCVKMLESGVRDEEKRKKYFRMTRDGLKRIEEIVRGLLDFARERPFDMREVSISDILFSSTELLKYKLREKKINLSVENMLTNSLISTDTAKLQQVLINLLMNSIESLEHESDGEIILRAYDCTRDGMNFVAIEVQDNGAGIKEEDRDKIFEPFFTTKGPREGTGLGLSISLGIVEAHGGKMEFESEAGKGALFRVVLPQ